MKNLAAISVSCPCGATVDVPGSLIPIGTMLQATCPKCHRSLTVQNDGQTIRIQAAPQGIVITENAIARTTPMMALALPKLSCAICSCDDGMTDSLSLDQCVRCGHPVDVHALVDEPTRCPICKDAWIHADLTDRCDQCEISQLRRSLGTAHIASIGDDRQWERLSPEQIAAHKGSPTAVGSAGFRELGAAHIMSAPLGTRWWEHVEPQQIDAIQRQVGDDPEAVRDAVLNTCQSCNGHGWLFTTEGRQACPVCFGRGHPAPPAPADVTKMCRQCGGAGSYWASGSWDDRQYDPCPGCEGSGQCPV